MGCRSEGASWVSTRRCSSTECKPCDLGFVTVPGRAAYVSWYHRQHGQRKAHWITSREPGSACRHLCMIPLPQFSLLLNGRQKYS